MPSDSELLKKGYSIGDVIYLNLMVGNTWKVEKKETEVDHMWVTVREIKGE